VTPLISLLCVLGLGQPVVALSPEDLPELVALEDRLVAEIAAPQLDWASDGGPLTAAGYTPAGRPAMTIIPTDGRPAFTIPGIASPRMAFAPSGLQFAGWMQDVSPIPGAPAFRLARFDARSGVGSALLGVAPFAGPSPVVWLSEPQRIIALRPLGEYTALVIYDPATEALAPLMATVAGSGTVLRKASTPGSVIVGTAGPDGTTSYFLLDVTTGIAMNVPEGERPFAAVESGGSAGVSPEGTLVALCRESGLWAGTPDNPEARRLLPNGDIGAHDFSAATQPVWSTTSEYLAYTVTPPGGTLSQVRLVTLGLEELACEVHYAPGSVPPQLGGRVWVCLELARDAQGNVVEPEWKTLKAELRVTSSPLPGAQGVTVRARSVGLSTGVIKRLTGRLSPPSDAPDESSLTIGMAGGPQQQVMRSFTLPALQGLIAWCDGSSLGTVTSVKVTRRALVLIGAPVNE